MKIILQKPSIHYFPPTTIQTKAAEFHAEFLNELLEHSAPLVLLSGGSAIPMYRDLFQYLAEKRPDLSNLTVSLFDERFVLRESPDSNEEQLRQVGVIELLNKHQAHWISYLGSTNRSGLEVAHSMSQEFAQQLFRDKELVIFAGIGEDGHTAGLLPTKNSLIIQEIFESDNNVEYYELPNDVINHFRQRLTSTPHLIRRAKHVIVYAKGGEKKQALREFLKHDQSISSFPSNALHEAANPVTIITDQKLD